MTDTSSTASADAQPLDQIRAAEEWRLTRHKARIAAINLEIKAQIAEINSVIAGARADRDAWRKYTQRLIELNLAEFTLNTVAIEHGLTRS
jgi:hypothetical protein